MRIETPLSRSLGLKYPIILAPMFIVSNKEMIVAAAEAGVLGTMPCLNARTAEEFRADLAWIRQRTDRAIGINVPLKLADPERIALDLEACIEFRVDVIISSLGNPKPVVEAAHAAGLKVYNDVVGLKHAQSAVRSGVDAIIAVAAGAGGHAGDITPFTLVPWLRDALPTPIVAAGAITDGRQIAASLALGAEAVYMGTRFIASSECAASDDYKRMLIEATPEDIVYTDQVSGIRGNFLRATVPGLGAPADRSGAKRWKDIWSAGQGVGLIREVKPVGEIVEDLVREYRDTLQGLPPALPD